VGARVLEDRVAEVEGDEVVRADEGADLQIARLQRADRADSQNPVAALLGQRPQVRLVVDRVGEDEGTVGAVALDDRRPLGRCRGGDLLAAPADRVAAEADGHSSHRPILCRLSRRDGP
jgi:hypothetical protein